MKMLVVWLSIGALFFLALVLGGSFYPGQAEEVKIIKFGNVISLCGPAAIWGISNYRSMCMGARL